MKGEHRRGDRLEVQTGELTGLLPNRTADVLFDVLTQRSRCYPLTTECQTSVCLFCTRFSRAFRKALPA